MRQRRAADHHAWEALDGAMTYFVVLGFKRSEDFVEQIQLYGGQAPPQVGPPSSTAVQPSLQGGPASTAGGSASPQGGAASTMRSNEESHPRSPKGQRLRVEKHECVDQKNRSNTR